MVIIRMMVMMMMMVKMLMMVRMMMMKKWKCGTGSGWWKVEVDDVGKERMMLGKMMLRRKADPKTGTHTLCEPAQSKYTSTFHKSHFIRKFTGKMPQAKLSPETGHTLCASLRSRNALQHFTRATLYRNLQEKWRAPDWAQNAGAHFVRACATDMHFKISEGQLYMELYRKNAAPQSEHPDQAPAFTLYTYVRTPQCGHTVWGINSWFMIPYHIIEYEILFDSDSRPSQSTKLGCRMGLP